MDLAAQADHIHAQDLLAAVASHPARNAAPQRPGIPGLLIRILTALKTSNMLPEKKYMAGS
jgi:hypothetical protein